jgi:hypothetical protein
VRRRLASVDFLPFCSPDVAELTRDVVPSRAASKG